LEIHTETLIVACEEVGLEVNVEKTKYMLVFGHYHEGQNHHVKIGKRRFENVAQFTYMGTRAENQNLI
jgi:hypothetical protein